jgi:anaerobic dimethyl sulfoxide reductase subunit B (iron-sulfur subunit)
MGSENMHQMAFYFDQTRCIGCYACTIACKDWNNTELDWREIVPIEKGRFPNLFVAYLSISCLHCANPSCVSICPANAISKREEDGIVVVDQEKCFGKDVCGMPCKEACSYRVPKAEKESNMKMQKCNFCLERLQDGKNPVCVGACPTRALDYGLTEELIKKYREIKEAEGFIYDAEAKPSIIFKSKRRL